MLKNFSLFIALRYLKPKRTYVSIITLISIVGVTLGVTVLIVVIAVMTGFEKKLEQVILGFEPHLRIEQQKTFYLDRGVEISVAGAEEGRWDIVRERLKAIPEVVSADPYVLGQVLLQFGPEDARRQAALTMMGAAEDSVSLEKRIGEILQAGEFDLGYSAEEGKFGCLVSLQFARNNPGIGLGAHIEAFSTVDVAPIVGDLLAASDNDELSDEDLRERVKELTESIQTPKDLVVTGIFDSARYGHTILVPLETGQDLYELDTDVHGIALELKDPFMADLVNRDQVRQVLPENWIAVSWIQRNKQLFDTVRNERGMMYFVLFFIILVAAFSTMNTMITVTVQKRQEIGVMKALGARVWQIVGVFIGQGMIVGLIGSVLGLGIASLVLHYRNILRDFLAERMGLSIFPEEMYGVSEIPAQIVSGDLAIICIGAFVLCTLAALPPAYMVARLDPARALRD